MAINPDRELCFMASIRNRFDVRSRLHEITVPTLVIAGLEDPQVPPIHTSDLYSDIPDSQLEIFDHGGHFPWIDESSKYAAVVTSFIRTVDRRAS